MHEQNAVGAIDGCHIPFVPDGPNKEKWRNRKGVYSQNAMAVVDFDGMFRYLCTGWEGSTHDSRVLKSCLQSPAAQFPRPPNGNIFQP